jgi:hypothetical protein
MINRKELAKKKQELKDLRIAPSTTPVNITEYTEVNVKPIVEKALDVVDEVKEKADELVTSLEDHLLKDKPGSVY